MVSLKYLILAVGIGVVCRALAPLVRHILGWMVRPARPGEASPEPPAQPPWAQVARRAGAGLCLVGFGLAIVVVPAGRAGIRVSQLWGTRPGTLYPGLHFVKPLLESVALYDIRDHVFTTGDPKKTADVLAAQSKEGLGIGLAISVRYRLDPARLDVIHATLPPDLDDELVTPVVASAFREVLPRYKVREVFSLRREEVRQKAAETILRRLASDGVLVKEVLLRDVVLPPEYAKGLEALLLKEQENERLDTEIQIKEKQVRETELEADAQKVREVKAAEAQAQVHVLQAKAQADAMQHTLPLKQKQIEQTRLESLARKEGTVRDAEAAAEAAVIRGKADAERDRIMADAEANRIRVTGTADSERMKLEAAVLKDNPLLIQKIVAERLSDKMQIMMVPMDGRYFFANDVFRGMTSTSGAPEEPAPTKGARAAARR